MELCFGAFGAQEVKVFTGIQCGSCASNVCAVCTLCKGRPKGPQSCGSHRSTALPKHRILTGQEGRCTGSARPCEGSFAALLDTWARLRRVCWTLEHWFPAGGIPGVTAIVGLWLSTGSSSRRRVPYFGRACAMGTVHVFLCLSPGPQVIKRLGKLDEETDDDYAAEIHAFWYHQQLRGVLDCHVRTKTDALILKYVLADPDSQLPPAERPEGAIGGVGRAAMDYLINRMQEQSLSCVRMEALSLKLYLAASRLGFRSIGFRVPAPPPQIHQIPDQREAVVVQFREHQAAAHGWA